MAISRLTGQDATNFAASTSVAVSYPGATTANNLLIAVTSCNGAQAALTAPAGFTQLIKGSATDLGGAAAIYYKLASGSETSISVSCSSASTMILSIFEYTGNANPVVVDGTAVEHDSSGGVTSLVTGNITTTNPNDLIFYYMSTNGSIPGPSWDVGTFFGFNSGSSFLNSFCGQNIVSATQTNFNATGSWTGAKDAAAYIGAFQAAASGPAAPATFARPATVMVIR